MVKITAKTKKKSRMQPKVASKTKIEKPVLASRTKTTGKSIKQQTSDKKLKAKSSANVKKPSVKPISKTNNKNSSIYPQVKASRKTKTKTAVKPATKDNSLAKTKSAPKVNFSAKPKLSEKAKPSPKTKTKITVKSAPKVSTEIVKPTKHEIKKDHQKSKQIPESATKSQSKTKTVKKSTSKTTKATSVVKNPKEKVVSYSERVTKAITLFNDLCHTHKEKLIFIGNVLETDGAANMNYPLASLESIMNLLTPSSETPDEAKLYFRANLEKIGRCDSTEDVLVLFGSSPATLDEFCISYLTFKQSFEFADHERDKFIKNQNAIAKIVVDFIESRNIQD